MLVAIIISFVSETAVVGTRATSAQACFVTGATRSSLSWLCTTYRLPTLSLAMVVPWGTADQIEFLESWIPAHKEQTTKRGKKQWKTFWARLFSAWFLRFPETDVEIPGKTPIRKVSVSRDLFE